MNLDKKYDNFIFQIAKKIKKYRENKDLSQSQISKLLGMDIKNYQRIEGGKHHFSLHTLFKISQVLDCKIKDLIDTP